MVQSSYGWPASNRVKPPLLRVWFDGSKIFVHSSSSSSSSLYWFCCVNVSISRKFWANVSFDIVHFGSLTFCLLLRCQKITQNKQDKKPSKVKRSKSHSHTQTQPHHHQHLMRVWMDINLHNMHCIHHTHTHTSVYTLT